MCLVKTLSGAVVHKSYAAIVFSVMFALPNLDVVKNFVLYTATLQLEKFQRHSRCRTVVDANGSIVFSHIRTTHYVLGRCTAE